MLRAAENGFLLVAAIVESSVYSLKKVSSESLPVWLERVCYEEDVVLVNSKCSGLLFPANSM
jgi:hypothetical protein